MMPRHEKYENKAKKQSENTNVYKIDPWRQPEILVSISISFSCQLFANAILKLIYTSFFCISVLLVFAYQSFL